MILLDMRGELQYRDENISKTFRTKSDDVLKVLHLGEKILQSREMRYIMNVKMKRK